MFVYTKEITEVSLAYSIYNMAYKTITNVYVNTSLYLMLVAI